MKLKFTFIVLLVITAATTPLSGQPAPPDEYKSVLIEGTDIFDEEELVGALKLGRYPAGSAKHFRKIAGSINEFYYSRGYIIARTYLVSEDESSVRIFVDEGKLGRVVIRNLDTIRTLRFKVIFNLPSDVYNVKLIDAEKRRLRREHGYKRIRTTLQPAKRYNETIFQLDDIYQVPLLGESRIPFFDRYGHRFNLIVEIDPPDKNGGKKTSQFTYGVDFILSTGAVPYLTWDRYRLIAPKDNFKLRLSTGIKYLVDLKPQEKPAWVYNKLNTQYLTPPLYFKRLTLRNTTDILHTRSSRKDLGYLEYTYGLLNTVVEPGVSLFKELRLYTGAGIEKLHFFDITYDPLAPERRDTGGTFWKYLQLSLELQNVLWGFKTEDTPVIKVSYSFYRQGVSFHQFTGSFVRSFAVRRASYYENRMAYEYRRGDTPFYHDIPVSGSAFRGLSGGGYFTHHSFKHGNSIRTSIYRDVIFAGVFADFIVFRGSGYDISGRHIGAVCGPSLSAIFLDQFQGEIYYGRDVLYPEKKYGSNLFFSVSKKW